MKLCKVFCLGLILSMLFLSSCDDGGVKDDKNKDENNESEYSYNVENVTVKSVFIDQSVLLAGHSGEVEVEIDSVDPKTIKNVPVSVVFLFDDDAEEQVEKDLEQFYSGTYLVEEVQPGLKTYKINIAIPQIDKGYGRYTIVAFLYEKIIDSLVQDGNLTDDDMIGTEVPIFEEGMGASADVDVDPTFEFDPDIDVSDPRLAKKAVIMRGTDGETINASFSFDIMTLAADVSNAKARFYVTHKDGSNKTPLKIKRADGSLVTFTNLPLLTAYSDKETLSYTLNFPNSFLKPLCDTAREYGEESFSYVISVEVECEDEPFEFTGNNIADTSITFVADPKILPEIGTEYHDSSEVSQQKGNDWFGIKLVTESDVNADLDSMSFEYSMSIPLCIAKKELNIISVKAEYSSGYYDTEGSLDYEIKGILKDLGKLGTLYNNAMDIANTANLATGGMKDPGSLFDTCLDFSGKDVSDVMGSLYSSGSRPNKHSDASIQHNWQYERDAMLGPVPVSFILGVNFYAGAGLSALSDLDGTKKGNFGMAFAPFASADGYISGGVGPSFVQVAGVRGELEFINATFSNIAYISFEDFVNSSNEKLRKMVFNFYSGLETDYLAGHIYVFVKYPWLKWKKTKWGVKYPVIRIEEADKTLAKWDAPIVYNVTFMETSNNIMNFPLDPL
ncbi:MAG: hypothetical protein JXK07_12135 [Spirochaetes bacterium]|nr:hypothetical protein [Spirochaetota bacterium]MBN2770409.1 hypothetical protein [Spirochaetota bacterium]